MLSSDEEGEISVDCVSDYEFENEANEYVTLACLPLLWQTNEEVAGDGKTRVFLSGFCDDGLQKIYKEVVAWRFELSYVQPEISVLCKGRKWAQLLKPRRQYEAAFRPLLITVHCLHFVKHNPQAAEESLWSHLSRVFSKYEVTPSEADCMNHLPLLRGAVDHDQILKDSEFMQRILSGQHLQRKALQVECVSAERHDFIVEHDVDEASEDEEFGEQEEELFDACCSFCDNGGDILCCEGRCMRSFHGSRQCGDDGEELCEGLGLSKAQIKTIPNFICKNCQYQKHQCFICGKLGSSNVTANTEVFPCIAGNCGRFYHPKCVVKELKQRNPAQVENLEEKIASGESFVCPAHRCFSCKQVENRTLREMQFAVCRRCPKSYHRKCLPREITFTEGDIGPTRAWDDLLPKRILIYCLDHEIVPHLGTPLRNHICFPNTVKVKIHTLEKLSTGSTVEQPKQKLGHSNLQSGTAEQQKLKLDHSNLLSETAVRNTKMQAPSEPSRLTAKHNSRPTFDGQKESYSSKLAITSTAHTKHLSKPYASSIVSGDDPVNRHSKITPDKKMFTMKPGKVNLRSEELNSVYAAKPLIKKQSPSTSSPVANTETERRINALIEKVDSSFNAEEFLKQRKGTSMYANKFTYVKDKNLTKGQVEGAVGAIRKAVQMLGDGASIDDAKAVCDADLLRQVSIWKKKLKLSLVPFFHGMHYSSFGRHFTKSDKLQEIVNRLHIYVQDGDTIVDFCCGANEFSCLMKEKLDSVGKTKCSFKNFDLFPSKNNFSFEQKDWFDVDPKDLPLGSRLIMGLNPPFGYKSALANKFINKALQFRPKLLILIVPPDTNRPKSKHLRYDLLWEDHDLLAGEAFYLPGAVDVHDKQISQWNNITPPLYLWSHPEWTQKHREMAREFVNLPNCQPSSSKHLPGDYHNVHGDFMNVYGNLPNVIDDVPKPILVPQPKPDLWLDQNLVPSNNIYSQPVSDVYGHHASNVYGQPVSNVYGQPVSNVYGQNMSHTYSRSGPVCDSYGNILNVEDKYINTLSVENRYGSVPSVGNPRPTNSVLPMGRQSVPHRTDEDMEIFPTNTPRGSLF